MDWGDINIIKKHNIEESKFLLEKMYEIQGQIIRELSNQNDEIKLQIQELKKEIQELKDKTGN